MIGFDSSLDLRYRLQGLGLRGDFYNRRRTGRISANAAKSAAIRSNTGAALNEFADKMSDLMRRTGGDLPQSNNSTTPVRDGFRPGGG